MVSLFFANGEGKTTFQGQLLFMEVLDIMMIFGGLSHKATCVVPQRKRTRETVSGGAALS